MLVRRARPEDAPAITDLYRDLVPGDDNIHVDPERLRALGTDPHNQLLVVEVNGRVCGSALLTIALDAMYGDQPYGVLENLIVDHDRRGRGIGRVLMQAVDQAARAARCTKLMLLSTAGRVDAHRFFARVGYDGERKRGFVKYLNRA
jgi:N-acetylglutamate synthase-like GNAT family acetyltransferase